MEQKHGGDIYRNRIDYDFSVNVNPLGMPDAVKNAAKQAIDRSSHYPDLQAEELRERMAEFFSLDRKQILVTNGAAEGIYLFFQALRPGNVLLVSPCFSEYEAAAAAAGAQCRFYSLKESCDYELDEEFCGYLTEDLDVVFLGNPNNPTGRKIPDPLLKKIRELCRDRDIYLCVDECFLPFTETAGSLIREISEDQKLLIFGAFTKIYAMAGLRLGYLISGNQELLKKIRQCIPPWNTSIPAQRAGIAALEELEYIERTKRMVKTEREYLMKEMRNGLARQVYPSDANFILFRAEENLYHEMIKHKLLIRSCANYRGLTPEHFRIAVRTPKENREFIKIWRRIIWQKH